MRTLYICSQYGFRFKKAYVTLEIDKQRKRTMISPVEAVTAILALFPYMSGNNRQCIIEHRTQIEQVLVEAQRQYPEMPTEVLTAVGFMETHLGCDQGEGGNWGAPISATRRHVAGTPMQAAAILWHSYEVCGTWEGAARRFRTGLCRNTMVGLPYSRRAISVANRLRSLAQNSQNINTTRLCNIAPTTCRTM